MIVSAYPTRGLLALLNSKRASLETEVIHLPSLEDWEHLLLMSQKAFLVVDMKRLAVGACLLAAIHEHVLGAGMAVNVDEQVDVAALERLTHHLLHTDYLGRRLLNRVHPLPIQI